ncbi:hypothetical protein [Leeia sp.]|uniref:hypothetical protein n=1 Tax=Leeia sp. TaxID=2884678 RepID=UPI0035B4A3FF
MTELQSRTLAHRLSQELSMEETHQVAGGLKPNPPAQPWQEPTMTSPYEQGWRWNSEDHYYESYTTIIASRQDAIFHNA